MKRIFKYILTFVVITLLVVLAARQLNKNKTIMESNAEIANQKLTIFPVSVVSPKTETLSQNFTISGEFEPMHQLNFVSETSGRVTSLKVENGDNVKKGQVIAILDNEQIRIDLKLAEANWEKAKADLEKYTVLAEGNAITKQQLEDIKIAEISAESRVQTLKRQLRVSTIVSPISGTINALKLEVGSYLAPGTPIADIIDVNSLKMQVSLMDHQVVRLKEGQKISIKPDLYADTPIEGFVSFIAPKADGSGKYLVEIEFKNSAKTPLKAGMTGVADFEFDGERSAFLLPVKCIAGSIQDPYIFVVSGDTVKSCQIQVGAVYGDKIEVLSGLQPTDVVVETGLSNLTNGSRIEIIQ
ncbi:MAG: efflux RND transporter periplasmic adaptor subunit [Bacteroidetes bacterium]|nr:efflux RND transporter periplasmic adaptor subunit [Bacteroidota bacterium]